MYVWCGENVSSDSLEMCCVFCSVVFVVVLVGFLDIIWCVRLVLFCDDFGLAGYPLPRPPCRASIVLLCWCCSHIIVGFLVWVLPWPLLCLIVFVWHRFCWATTRVAMFPSCCCVCCVPVCLLNGRGGPVIWFPRPSLFVILIVWFVYRNGFWYCALCCCCLDCVWFVLYAFALVFAWQFRFFLTAIVLFGKCD